MRSNGWKITAMRLKSGPVQNSTNSSPNTKQMAKQSQTDQILNYLSNGKVITPIEALNKFGCLRLAARIADLRKSGHLIFTDSITKNGKTFASYKLIK
jgi:23S rRNA pseudoU1915 N3-methylase RlmH